MQSVSSGAVYNYAKKLYVKCSFNGTSISVTNNLNRSDLQIECIGLVANGEIFSYVLRTNLNQSETAQTITSYGGRQLQYYLMCFVNIVIKTTNHIIASGVIANVVGNVMELDILC